MSISISVGQPEQKNAFATQPEKPEKTIGVKLNMRRSLKGDIMIFDHADIDIVLDVEKKTITVFPKEVLNDMTYGAQDRLFKFLVKKGVITPESVQENF